MVNFLSLKSDFLSVKTTIGYILVATFYYGIVTFFMGKFSGGLVDFVYKYFGFNMIFIIVLVLNINSNDIPHKTTMLGKIMIMSTVAVVYAVFYLFLKYIMLY